MNVSTFLADPAAIKLTKIISGVRTVTLVVKTFGRCARCPRCQQVSARVHSRYQRKVADLPWLGVPVRLELAFVGKAARQLISVEKALIGVEENRKGTRQQLRCF